ncbi:MAG: site-specific integrase [Gammaproteobacteria bacterium]|jgi:integrase|nr:site-specific integrase [Gammaproteobacteria bacterium]
MARQVKDARLETRQSRLRLPPNKDPYWRLICSGCYIGYRKGPQGGSWWFRLIKPGTKSYKRIVIGKADDVLDSDGVEILSFKEAQLKTHELIETLLKDHPKSTVKYAIEHYLKWFKENRKSINETQASINAHILPYFGDKLISDLTTKEIKAWHQKLASSPARKRSSKFGQQQYRNHADSDDKKRSRKATANRTLSVFKAILNKAYQDEVVDDDLAWRRVKPFEKVDEPKVRFLTEAEAKRLINAAKADLRQMIQAALYTGARFNELASLKVCDVHLNDKPYIYIQPSKNGKSRYVPLNESGTQFFKKAIIGKLGNHFVFTKNNNMPWGKNHHVRLLKEACTNARIESTVSFHELRHTYASLLAQAGADLLTISKLLGHADTRVTSRHYAHLCDKTLANIVNEMLPSFSIQEKYINVLPILA